MELGQSHLQEDLEPRLKKISGIILIVVGLIVLRLYYLQGIRGNFYHLFSEENSIRETPIPALRGVMWDRNGIPLVENRASFDLILTPQYVVDPKKLFEVLERHLNIPRESLETKWAERLKQPVYQPIMVMRDVPLDMVSWVKAHKNPWGKLSEDMDLRGVDTRLRYQREYLDGDTPPSVPDREAGILPGTGGGDIASHVLGYVREIDSDRLKNFQKKWPGRYRLGNEVGVRGLEEVWDLQLRGEDGFSQKVVNAVGREIVYPGVEEELADQEAVDGEHLKLTLDSRLQKVARDYFKGKAGAAVALDPRDGAVLLFYSAPSFDLNRLESEEGNKYWQEISTNPTGYLLNRPIQGAYPPGSTYKIVVSTAALQEGVVQPQNQIHCTGALNFGNRAWHCWRAGGHGIVDFHRALVASCDVYFYNMGLRLGVDRLAEYAKAFGLGSQTGIDLPDERSGLIPTSEWKLKYRKEPWQEGETLPISIGQGYDSVTPLQGAVMIATIANNGKRVRPHLVQNTMDPVTGEEKPVAHLAVTDRHTKTLSPDVLKRVKEGLVGVVADPEGTAHRLSLLKIPMGGKTGTAQVVALGKDCRGNLCDDHAWFVGFAPAEDPQIAVAVLVEHGGHGSSAAAPLAGELIKTYLSDQQSAISHQPKQE